jgi:TRAP-type C4-dicarboxylate transport system substrate-binding protein
VVKKDVWDRIQPDVQKKLLQIAEDYGERTRQDVRKQNEDAIEQMKKRGLTIVQPANIEEWHRIADLADEVIRGKVVPAGIYDELLRIRKEYRAQHKR